MTSETVVGQADKSSNYATANNIVFKDVKEKVKSVSRAHSLWGGGGGDLSGVPVSICVITFRVAV
jgi:hypothetical protein